MARWQKPRRHLRKFGGAREPHVADHAVPPPPSPRCTISCLASRRIAGETMKSISTLPQHLRSPVPVRAVGGAAGWVECGWRSRRRHVGLGSVCPRRVSLATRLCGVNVAAYPSCHGHGRTALSQKRRQENVNRRLGHVARGAEIAGDPAACCGLSQAILLPKVGCISVRRRCKRSSPPRAPCAPFAT